MQRKLVSNELSFIQAEMNRTEFYISLLQPKYMAVFNKIYIEENTVDETAGILDISKVTVRRYIERGVNNLTDMYNSLIVT